MIEEVETLSIGTMPTHAEFCDLVQRANAGDEKAVSDLRRMLDENPVIWQKVGDLGAYARHSLLTAISAGNQLLFESITRSADELGVSLQSSAPSKLEELAVERVITSWLELKWVEMKHPSPGAATLQQSRFNLRLKDSAARRYEHAVRSLVLIQKFLPAMGQDLKPKIARVAG